MARPTSDAATVLPREVFVVLRLDALAPIILRSDPVAPPRDSTARNQRQRVEVSIVAAPHEQASPLHATLHGAARVSADDAQRFELTVLPRDVRAHCTAHATPEPPASPTLWQRTRTAAQTTYRPVWVIATP